MIMAISAWVKPMPSTRIEPVIAPVMIIGNPAHTSVTENRLRRALAGTASCSYSLPSKWSTCSSTIAVVAYS